MMLILDNGVLCWDENLSEEQVREYVETDEGAAKVLRLMEPLVLVWASNAFTREAFKTAYEHFGEEKYGEDE